MTPAQLDLARRLVAHPKWRWVAGMVADEMRLMGPEEVPVQLNGSNGGWICDDNPSPPFPMIPDLTDYATAAILLRMAHEADQTDRRHSPVLVYAGGVAAVPADRNMVWGCHIVPGDKHGWAESKDLGTVAAQALLAAWGEP